MKAPFQDQIKYFSEDHHAILSSTACHYAINFEIWETIGGIVKKTYFETLPEALEYFNTIKE